MLFVQDAMLPSTSRTNWAENSNMPDSMSTNIVGRSELPPVAPKFRSSDVGLTSRNTLKILNTIKLITSAFRTMDMARPVTVSVLPQSGTESWPCTRDKGAEPPTIQTARGNRSKSANE